MNSEQKMKLVEIGKKIQEVLIDFHGSIRYNIVPERKTINFNVEESHIIETPKNGERKNI